MGVAVSGWRLARTVSSAGQLGVVSGTLLPVVLARRLQLGDLDGDLRRAFDAFPDRGVVDRVLARYLVPGGKDPKSPFAPVPMPSAAPSRLWLELAVLANFAEVWLAKSGHEGRVGVNLLEKIQVATLASVYGAMLAGVDVVLMGAGIPRAIPGVLDKFAAGEAAEIALDVHGPAADGAEPVRLRFDPADFFGGVAPALRRPLFLAIVGSAALATTLARKSTGRVDGFVVESAAAGGHNAPPRGGGAPGPDGQPVYGPRDEPELEKFRALGLPFWLAGERASPERLAEARALGAAGVQIGTAFAFCAESGLAETHKRHACEASREGTTRLFTDPLASPTGFPFKTLDLPGVLSRLGNTSRPPRRCDIGYLRQPFRRPNGELGYRCPAEPAEDFAGKGGDTQDCEGRMCLCNGLLAAVGLGQVSRADVSRDTPQVEPAIITAGAEAAGIARFLRAGEESYSARAVLDHVLGAGANV